jgi:fructosamine-3-kinase
VEPGYAERREVYNLYHLLNHLTLFGSSYAGSVASVLKRFA